MSQRPQVPGLQLLPELPRELRPVSRAQRGGGAALLGSHGQLLLQRGAELGDGRLKVLLPEKAVEFERKLKQKMDVLD